LIKRTISMVSDFFSHHRWIMRSSFCGQ